MSDMRTMHHSYVPSNLMRLELTDGSVLGVGSVHELGRHTLSHIFSVQLPDGSFTSFDERLVQQFTGIFDKVSFGTRARLEALAVAVCAKFNGCDDFFAALAEVAIKLDDSVAARSLGGLKTAAPSVLDREAHYPAMKAAALAIDVDILNDADAYVLGSVGIDTNRFVSGFSASPRFQTLEQLEEFCAGHLEEYETAGDLLDTQGAYPSRTQWSTILSVPVEAMSYRSNV